jgi:hypothetical protein
LGRSRDTGSDEISGGTDSSFVQATYSNLLAPYLTPGSNCRGVSSSYRDASTISSDSVYTAAMACATGNSSITTAQAAS